MRRQTERVVLSPNYREVVQGLVDEYMASERPDYLDWSASESKEMDPRMKPSQGAIEEEDIKEDEDEYVDDGPKSGENSEPEEEAGDER